MSHPSPEACAACPAHHLGNLSKLGVDMAGHDYVVALAGNPNTGKSTVFNALTGLRQHTGNWPGKTVTRAEGGFAIGGHRYKLVDLPGTYSLLSASLDEEVARDFILFGAARRDGHRRRRHDARAQPEPRAAGARDHQPRRGLPQPDGRGPPARPRGRSAPAGPRSRRARRGDGGPPGRRPARADAGDRRGGAPAPPPRRPPRVAAQSPALQRAVTRVSETVLGLYPQLPNSAWVALRLLDGDERIQAALRSGELGELHQPTDPPAPPARGDGARCAGGHRGASRWPRSCAGRSARSSTSR